jgi:hypothetical protein
MHGAGDAIERVTDIDSSNPSRSRMPNVRPGRVLSVDAVLDDMRAVLWPDSSDPDHRDQVTGPASTISAQDEPRLAQDRGVRVAYISGHAQDRRTR